MILYIYGEDTFRSLQQLGDLKKRFLEKAGTSLNLLEIDCAEDGTARVFEELKSLPLFASARLVVVRDFLGSATPADKEKILPLLEKEVTGQDLVILFYEQGKQKKKPDAVEVLLLAQKNTFAFDRLSGYDLSQWAKGYAESINCKIEPQALEMLIIRSGGETWWIATAMQKLCSFAGGEIVTSKHVQEMTRLRIDPEIFQTIDAVAEKNGAKALTLLHDHLKGGENELYLLSMINYQFANLLRVSELQQKGMTPAEIKKETKLHPFVIEKTTRQLKNFSPAKLRAIYAKLAEVDGKIKTGKIDAGIALDILVVGLTA